MSYLIKEKMMRDKSNQDDSVTLGDSEVGVVDKNVSAKKEGGTEGPLFQAKKEKVEVAGYNHLPAVVENEKSSFNIDRLPNEMLEKIFEILIELENDDGSNRKSKLALNNQDYLNCRLVSTRWKFWMESVLEKKSISIWKAVPIPIPILKGDPPALGHLFVHQAEDECTPVKWTVLPPPLESWDGNGSPFPSHSLKLTTDWDNCDNLLPSPRPMRAQLIRLTDFFSKFGEHLTSLILTSVTLSPETFIGILENTPKLKAINLNLMVFRGNLVNCAQLPALQHLQHVRVFQVKILEKKVDTCLLWNSWYNDGGFGENRLYHWLLSPYKEQLVTLDIYGRVGIKTATNYANLERLFVYIVNFASFLQRNLFLYPRLKSLFLMNVQINFNGDIIEWFQQHIEPLAKTLSEFHLDIAREWVEVGPLFELSTNLTHSQNKIAEVVFPEMKTFAITFPEFRAEVDVIKTLIKGFPNLETLMFLDRFQEAREDAQSILGSEEYVEVCPKLKKVMIRPL